MMWLCAFNQVTVDIFCKMYKFYSLAILSQVKLVIVCCDKDHYHINYKKGGRYVLY